ncbi:MAG TPA: carboxymuconolactone decarboxylase family protein [Acidimicrobiales bacterium]|jgi:alkylhydroperoxidase family enzyme
MTSTPPRLGPLPFADWDEQTRTVLLAHLRRPERYLSGEPDAPPMPVVLELFARNLPLSQSWLPFTDMLAGAEASLEPRLRELLILRVAWRTKSGYEWGQHARMGRDEGLSDAQVDAVAVGAAAPIWTAEERALLEATDEIIDASGVSDGTWDQLASFFDEAQLLELLFVIGGYLCLAGVLNSIGLRGEMPGSPDEVTPAP